MGIDMQEALISMFDTASHNGMKEVISEEE